MKSALHKSAIPISQVFTIRRLREKHFDPVWHAHSEFQLFVVLEGSGTRFIGDSIKSFQAGELVFTGPNLPHVWRSDEAYFEGKHLPSPDGIVIYFGEQFLGDHSLDKEELVILKKLFARSMRGLEFYGQKKRSAVEMMHDLLNLRGVPAVMRFLQLLDLLAGSKEYHYISSKSFQETFDATETDRLNIVYDYVFKNFRQKVRLEALAELLHMTPTSFSRYFTMRNNKPFSRFIAEIRIKHACKLLTETTDPIEVIGYECGFNTPSNFNKQFKDHMLKTPGDYRKEFLSI